MYVLSIIRIFDHPDVLKQHLGRLIEFLYVNKYVQI